MDWAKEIGRSITRVTGDLREIFLPLQMISSAIQKVMKVRIAMAKDAFNKRKELLTKGLSMTLKERMVKVLV